MSNQLQHRLFNFEVEPPAGMWDAISGALEDQSTKVAVKLRNFEELPDARLWKNIENELDAEAETPSTAIPFYRRYATPLRYGSAVAMLVLAILTLSLLLNKNGDPNEIAQQRPASQSVRQIPQPNNQVVTVRETPDPHLQQPRTKTKTSVQKPDNNITSNSGENSTAIKATQRAAAGRYLMLASETGKTVRLSKKVYPVFDCAEHSTALERFQCQENIESLQKMASSLISPSGDFASLIDMIKTLEENR